MPRAQQLPLLRLSRRHRNTKAAKLTRKPRVITSTLKFVGQEDRVGGEIRVVTQQAKQPGIFTASSYFWLYYAVYPGVGVTIVPVGALCKSDREAHAMLDPVENVVDAVKYSNSTYELAGVDSSRLGLLYAKTLPCLCSVCGVSSSIRWLPLNRTNDGLPTADDDTLESRHTTPPP